MAKQKTATPLDYVHFLAGWPPPENEPDPVQVPVPTPVYMPNPRMVDEAALFGNEMDMGMGNPYDQSLMGGPTLPPPIAPPAPPGFTGGNGFMAPEGGPFG